MQVERTRERGPLQNHPEIARPDWLAEHCESFTTAIVRQNDVETASILEENGDEIEDSSPRRPHLRLGASTFKKYRPQ